MKKAVFVTLLVLLSSCAKEPSSVINDESAAVKEKFKQMSQIYAMIKRGDLEEKKVAVPEPLKVYYSTNGILVPFGIGYDGHNTVHVPLQFLKDFRAVLRDMPPTGFHIHLSYIADAFLRNKLRRKYKEFHDVFEKQVDAFLDIKYIIVQEDLNYTLPEFNLEKKKLAVQGRYEGRVYLFKLEGTEYLGSQKISATGSDKIDIPDRFQTVTETDDGADFQYSRSKGKYVHKSELGYSDEPETHEIDLGKYATRVKVQLHSDYTGKINDAVKEAVPYRVAR